MRYNEYIFMINYQLNDAKWYRKTIYLLLSIDVRDLIWKCMTLIDKEQIRSNATLVIDITKNNEKKKNQRSNRISVIHYLI
jgi:hypothetical protein